MDGNAFRERLWSPRAKRSRRLQTAYQQIRLWCTPALDGGIAVSDRETPETKRLMFTNTYDVESAARNVHASGRVETTLVLTIIDGALKVVDQKEIARPTRR